MSLEKLAQEIISKKFIKFINYNLDKLWNWFYFYSNPNITIKNINNNLNKPWSWYNISGNEFKKKIKK